MGKGSKKKKKHLSVFLNTLTINEYYTISPISVISNIHTTLSIIFPWAVALYNLYMPLYLIA